MCFKRKKSPSSPRYIRIDTVPWLEADALSLPFREEGSFTEPERQDFDLDVRSACLDDCLFDFACLVTAGAFFPGAAALSDASRRRLAVGCPAEVWADFRFAPFTCLATTPPIGRDES